MRQAGYFESPPTEAYQDLFAPSVVQQAPARRARGAPAARASAGGMALLQWAPPAAAALGRAAAGGPAPAQPPPEDLDSQIDRAQEAMTLLAQDAAALSAELQVLDSALRAAPATPSAQRRPAALPASLSMLGLGGPQVPYLPPPDANALAEAGGVASGASAAGAAGVLAAPPVEAAAGAAAVPEASAPIGAPMPDVVETLPAGRARTPGFIEVSNFESRFWTLDHSLSDFWTVALWALIFLLPVGCCCMCSRRRPRAQDEHLMR